MEKVELERVIIGGKPCQRQRQGISNDITLIPGPGGVETIERVTEPGETRLSRRINQLNSNPVIFSHGLPRPPEEGQVNDSLVRVGSKIIAQKLKSLAEVVLQGLGDRRRVKGSSPNREGVRVDQAHVDQLEERPRQEEEGKEVKRKT